MERKLLGHLVRFRYHESILYGEVIDEYVNEKDDSFYVIQAGTHIFRGIPATDMIHDYGMEIQ